MSACPTRFVVGGLLMATTALLTVAFSSCSGPAAAEDPYMNPVNSDYRIYSTHIDLDGQTYRCVIRSTQGIDCDWDHPLQPIQTPTPAPSRTDR